MTIGHDFAYYLLAQIAVVAAFAFVYRRGAAAGRAARRAGRRPHRRRPALPQLHRRQVQPRRHPAAVLGAGRLCLPPRAARPADDRLAAARPGGRDVAVGEIFRRGAGDAVGAVRPDRPRRAQTPDDAGALYRDRGRAGRHGAASGLAGAERFPALRLCRTPRRCPRAADRPCLAPAAIRGQPIVLPDSVAADRGAAVLAAPRAPANRRLRRRPTPSTAASSRCSPSDRWRRCWRFPPSAAAAPWRCGAIRSGCFSACGSCSPRAARSTAAAWRACCATWAIVFTCLALAFVANYAVLPRFDHRYRAVFFPGGELGRESRATLSRRHRQADRLRDRHACGTAAMSRITRRAIRAC